MTSLEPITLGLGLGLTALFTSCIECFEYFKAAQNLRKDFEVLLIKLEWEQERLLVWGEVIGIDQQGPSQELKSLQAIKFLLEDADCLKSKYGVQAIASFFKPTGRQGISSNAVRRLRVRLGRASNSSLGELNRTRWAIHDASKFGKLVVDLRDLIDDLQKAVPAAQNIQDDKFQDDIASMVDDLESLRLLTEACEDVYHNWSNVARSAIDASDFDTINNELSAYQFDYYQESAEDLEVGEIEPSLEFKGEVALEQNTQVFFVLIEQCRNEIVNSPCDMNDLASLASRSRQSFIPNGSHAYGSTPGHWIAKEINPQEFTSSDLMRSTEAHLTLRASKLRNGEFDRFESCFSGYHTGLDLIDRQWMEQSIYDDEEEVRAVLAPAEDRMYDIVRSHASEKLCAAIIIIGEIDYCSPLLSAPPFPPNASGRNPQETQMFKLRQGYGPEVYPEPRPYCWIRHYMGTYAKREPLKRKLAGRTSSHRY